MSAHPRFSLVKWYMDCVTTDGDTAILYCADLRWRGIHTRYSSVLERLGNTVRTKTSLARFHLDASAESITVRLPRLRVSGTWQADSAPVQRAIYASETGTVDWNCLQPRSTAQLSIGDHQMSGLGYAECLMLTIPPWQLPMRQLRWGRFVSAQHALTWIDWQGPYSTSVAVLDGRHCRLTAASESEIVLPNVRLCLDQSVPLRSGSVDSTILPVAPALRRLLPRSLFSIEEHKRRSRGTLHAPNSQSEGWVIHEVVHWPR